MTRTIFSWALILLWLAHPAAADVVVSNLGEPERSLDDIDASLWSAQSFETDAQARLLTGISAIVGGEVGTSGAFAEIRSAGPAGEMDPSPAGLVATLSLPDLRGPRSARLFLPDALVLLAPSTRYYVMMGATGPGSFEWSYAEGNAQSGVGLFSQYEHSFDGGLFWSVFGIENPFHLKVEAIPADPDVLVSNLAEPVRDLDEIGPVLWSAQSFETDGRTHLLTDIGAWVGGESGVSGAFAELRAAAPTGEMDLSPAGLITPLALPDLTGPRSVRSFVPLSSVVLSPNTRYYVLMGGVGPGFFEWSYAEGNAQVGAGTLAAFQHSEDAGASWPILGVENPLHLQVRTVPEPAAVATWLCGVAGCFGLRRRRELRRSGPRAS